MKRARIFFYWSMFFITLSPSAWAQFDFGDIFSGLAAATFTVNMATDEPDGDLGDGKCDVKLATPGDQCTLRAAIQQANENAGQNAIVFELTYPATITVGVDPLPAIMQDLVISGPGAANLTIDGNHVATVFRILGPIGSPASVTISGLTITHGKGFWGGAIEVREEDTLNLSSSVITDNEAFDGGGLVFVEGTATVTDTLISSNRATNGYGGGIVNSGANVTIERSTISGNEAKLNGGGISSSRGTGTIVGSLALKNTTVSGNRAGEKGGGLFTFSPLPGASHPVTLTNVTITNNIGDADAAGGAGAGGLVNEKSTVTVKNSIIAKNYRNASPDNCSESNPLPTSAGHNLEDGNDCGFSGTGDRQNADSRLAALANNGGLTLTHSLLAGSPAIDTADSTVCPPKDQRNQNRCGPCDKGSFEVPCACGDGNLQTVAGEQCDDGNIVSGDGCSSTCQIEAVAETPPPSEPAAPSEPTGSPTGTTTTADAADSSTPPSSPTPVAPAAPIADPSLEPAEGSGKPAEAPKGGGCGLVKATR
jgi:CSLREA domain-containing protein